MASCLTAKITVYFIDLNSLSLVDNFFIQKRDSACLKITIKRITLCLSVLATCMVNQPKTIIDKQTNASLGTYTR